MKQRSTRGETTRARILQSAAELIARNGANGTSVDDVLAASGTGKSQFYHYFTNKEALVREVIGYQLARLPAAREELLAGLDSLAGIEAWLDQIERDQQAGLYNDGCPIGSLASEMANQSEDIRQNLDAVFSKWESSLANGLKSMLVKGQLRPGTEPMALSVFIVAAIEGGLLLAKTSRVGSQFASTLAQLRAHLRAQCLGASRSRPAATPKKVPLSFCP